MLRNFKSKMSILAVSTALAICSGFIGYATWQQHLWRSSVAGVAESYGVARANEDFQAGKVQLFVVVDERSESSFNGSNDGPFKVVAFSSHPYDYPSRFVAAKTVEGYNRRMRALHNHPERYIARTNAEGRVEWK